MLLCCRYGMVLQQCAHFYNNIATEMIPCQKPMMLAEAVEFEKVWDVCVHVRASRNYALPLLPGF